MQTATFRAKPLDFDLWAELARSDPDGFERMRLQTIDEAINRAAVGHQERLRRLQWRVDRVRERAKTPMAACIAISDMMWDSLNQLNTSFKALSHGEPRSVQPCAQVIPFRRRPH